MELNKLEEKLRGFYPCGKEIYVKNKKLGNYSYFNIQFQILKMEFEIEKHNPLRIAVYLKLLLLDGFVHRIIKGEGEFNESDYVQMIDRDFFESVFYKYKFIGVYFLKIKNCRTDKSIVITFKN